MHGTCHSTSRWMIGTSQPDSHSSSIGIPISSDFLTREFHCVLITTWFNMPLFPTSILAVRRKGQNGSSQVQMCDKAFHSSNGRNFILTYGSTVHLARAIEWNEDTGGLASLLQHW